MKLHEEFKEYENLWEAVEDTEGLTNHCDVCGKNPGEFVNSRKQCLCNDCNTKYRNSEKGKLELFVELAIGVADATDYTAQEIDAAAKSWSKYSHELPFFIKTLSSTHKN